MSRFLDLFLVRTNKNGQCDGWFREDLYVRSTFLQVMSNVYAETVAISMH